MSAPSRAVSNPRAGTRVTATAPSNIALIKYWGARDLERALPVNPSLSMTLSRCVSETTVEVLAEGRGDEIFLAGDGRLEPAPEAFAGRVRTHLGRLRAWGAERGFPAELGLRVATRNSFPAAAGLASSASGFAALAVAVTAAMGLAPTPRELSWLARASGSGSAARSVLGGYVQWPGGEGEEGAWAHQVFPPEHWDLRDVIAILEAGPKKVSSLEGHRRAPTSPHFETRLAELPDRLEAVRRAIAAWDFDALAPVVEEEAIELHLIAMSSRPPVFYWSPGTVEVLAAVRELRREGMAAASTMDAGANVHVLCTPEAEPTVVERLQGIALVREILRDRVGTGPALAGEHLF